MLWFLRMAAIILPQKKYPNLHLNQVLHKSSLSLGWSGWGRNARDSRITSPCFPIANTAVFQTEQFSVRSIFPFISKNSISAPVPGLNQHCGCQNDSQPPWLNNICQRRENLTAASGTTL